MVRFPSGHVVSGHVALHGVHVSFFHLGVGALGDGQHDVIEKFLLEEFANARLDLRPMQYKPLRAVHSNRSRYLPAWQYKPLQVFLAAAADTGGDRKKAGGVYFDVMKAVKATEAATDPELARKLWQVSEKLTGTKIDL